MGAKTSQLELQKFQLPAHDRTPVQVLPNRFKKLTFDCTILPIPFSTKDFIWGFTFLTAIAGLSATSEE